MALRWITPERLGHAEVRHDVAEALRFAAADAALLDPYLRWALETDGRGFLHDDVMDLADAVISDARNLCFRLIFEVHSLQQCLALRDDPELGLRVDPVYAQDIGLRWPLHFTASIPVGSLDRLMKLALPGVRWELAVPLRVGDPVPRGTPAGRYGITRDTTVFPAEPVLARALGRRRPRIRRPLDSGGRGTIAVIDFGCPFLNERFCATRTGEARVKALWDQGKSAVPPVRAEGPVRNWPWQKPGSFTYGRELAAGDIQTMVTAVRAGGSAARHDESEAYRGIDYLVSQEDPRRRIWHATHGSHVLDVVGGSVDPLTGEPDAAGAADLIFVQLPALTAADSSGASLSGYLLDGLRYVFAMADPHAPLVINISYGSYAGPHDGSSLIERAITSLLACRKDDFAVVLAAGNSRTAGAHQRRDVRPGRSAVFQAVLVAGDTTDTFIEFWYGADPEVTLEARVRSPLGDWSEWCGPGRQVVLSDQASGESLAMLRHDLHVPRGERAMLLLAVAPTEHPENVSLVPAPAGDWDVEIRIVEDGGRADVTIDAWIERDEPLRSGGFRSHFVKPDEMDDRHTLSSLAHAEDAVIVGACYRDSARELPYSSLPDPKAVRKPLMVWAACEDSPDERGILAAAVRSTDAWRMNGTSVAAPVVARRLFNRMKKQRVRRSRMSETLRELAEEGDGLVRMGKARGVVP